MHCDGSMSREHSGGMALEHDSVSEEPFTWDGQLVSEGDVTLVGTPEDGVQSLKSVLRLRATSGVLSRR